MSLGNVIEFAGVLAPVAVALVVALMVSGRDDRRQRETERRAIRGAGRAPNHPSLTGMSRARRHRRCGDRWDHAGGPEHLLGADASRTGMRPRRPAVGPEDIIRAVSARYVCEKRSWRVLVSIHQDI